MISFKCKNCGGEMSVNKSGELECPYCGGKSLFSDKDFEEYKGFRKEMLQYLKNLADRHDTGTAFERLWDKAEQVSFVQKNGAELNIRYVYTAVTDGVTMYCARKNVLFLFSPDQETKAELFLNNISKISFPSADVKNLDRCVPTLIGRFELSDGSILLAFSKDENVFPIGVFGKLRDVHVEWIISRMENIACLLQYNDKCHSALEKDNILINPVTHEACLAGGWQNLCECSKENMSGELAQIRMTAQSILETEGAAKPLLRFIESQPAENAFEDFAKWDNVIENELGGRHFSRFE